MSRSKLLLTKEKHREIQEAIKLDAAEDYSVVTHKRHGEWERSVHVFNRLPTTKELTIFENTSSKVKFRGANKAEIDSGAVAAAEVLYNKLISRVYNLPQGPRKVLAPLDGPNSKSLSNQEARELVPPLVKREALRDFVGEVYSESRISEREGDDDEVKEGEGEEPGEDFTS